MSDTVRVSVVIPVYNGARFIEMAVRSALASDLDDLEVLVVDDGSTDGSGEIVRHITDPRVVVLRQTASGGPSRPRNVAITRASAPYVALLDADDLMKPDKLSSAVTVLDSHPEAGFAFADFERIDADGTVLAASNMTDYPVFRGLRTVPAGASWRIIPRSELARALLAENFIGTSGVILRKSMLAEVGMFDESLAYSEDRDLWFRLAHRCDALYREKVGHSYRVNAASLTYGPVLRNAQHRITVLRRERCRWRDRSALRQIDRLIAENLANIGYEYRSKRRRLSSMAMFMRAFATSPELRWMRGLLGSLLPQGLDTSGAELRR
jgi:glycosyltransferase involved in cell wall biosynthesis